MIRVLALDGGGAHAGLMARALGEIYGMDEPGPDIIRRFACVAGNSGGSIVMTALCCGYTPREIVDLYESPATLRRLFSPKWTYRLPRWRVLSVIPRESSRGKFAALKEVFDRKTLPGGARPSEVPIQDWPGLLGSPVDLLVAAFDYDRERASFFRSNLTSPAASSATPNRATLIEAVHASTNAPIAYYDEPAVIHRRRYWDGALAGYNNPVLAAVIEAMARNPTRVDEMRVLSVGAIARAFPVDEGIGAPWGRSQRPAGIVRALSKAAFAIFDDPPDAASFHAHVALGQPLPAHGETSVGGHLVRLCPLLGPRWKDGRWEPLADLDAGQFRSMRDVRLDCTDAASVGRIRATGDHWIAGRVRNQPIRLGEHLRCDIGHETFAAGRAHWLAISGEAAQPA